MYGARLMGVAAQRRSYGFSTDCTFDVLRLDMFKAFLGTISSSSSRRRSVFLEKDVRCTAKPRAAHVRPHQGWTKEVWTAVF
jgi:hypothetical protein